MFLFILSVSLDWVCQVEWGIGANQRNTLLIKFFSSTSGRVHFDLCTNRGKDLYLKHISSIRYTQCPPAAPGDGQEDGPNKIFCEC